MASARIFDEEKSHSPKILTSKLIRKNFPIPEEPSDEGVRHRLLMDTGKGDHHVFRCMPRVAVNHTGDHTGQYLTEWLTKQSKKKT